MVPGMVARKRPVTLTAYTPGEKVAPAAFCEIAESAVFRYAVWNPSDGVS